MTNDKGEVVTEYEAVNSEWLLTEEDGEQSCRWPSKDLYKRNQLTKLVKELAPADEGWPILPCEVLKFYGKFI